jgi:RNA recognition motif-containing protein
MYYSIIPFYNSIDFFFVIGHVIRADVSSFPSGRSKGFGTVTFGSETEAEKAIDLFHDYDWQGRRLEVREDLKTSTYHKDRIDKEFSTFFYNYFFYFFYFFKKMNVK